MDTRKQRGEAVAGTIDRIRAVERDRGVTRDALDAIKGLLVELAGRRELFPPGDFPVTAEDGTGVIYRLAEDPDHRFALYATAGAPGKSVPPHNHTTWAVIVGVHGDEHNVFYERVDDGSVPGRGEVRPSGEFTVTHGTGVTLMADDIHSIHVTGDEPTVHLHLYGLALEQLHRRIMFDTAEGTCKVFPATQNIRPA
ncbi:MAG: cysteine dioxygenase [Rhodospirillales bacterium]